MCRPQGDLLDFMKGLQKATTIDSDNTDIPFEISLENLRVVRR
jgi:hypothetical protein